ncbi:hypothetical protein [Saccharothrix sp. HUAS TT1]|uniref:hypothetical protein n=1 Tax=unclassified Saccharothrix TaxID=2593673 RepID=UPI00345C397D
MTTTETPPTGDPSLSDDQLLTALSDRLAAHGSLIAAFDETLRPFLAALRADNERLYREARGWHDTWQALLNSRRPASVPDVLTDSLAQWLESRGVAIVLDDGDGEEQPVARVDMDPATLRVLAAALLTDAPALHRTPADDEIAGLLALVEDYSAAYGEQRSARNHTRPVPTADDLAAARERDPEADADPDAQPEWPPVPAGVRDFRNGDPATGINERVRLDVDGVPHVVTTRSLRRPAEPATGQAGDGVS